MQADEARELAIAQKFLQDNEGEDAGEMIALNLAALLARHALEARKAALEEAAQHEVKMYAAEGPVTGRDGTFTVAFLGCTCGWNSDGEISKKETWGAHIRSLAERASKGAGGSER